MSRKRHIAFLLLCTLCLLPVKAEEWFSHKAYNNVTLIAAGTDKVFALSDGSLFSVNKLTEQIETYDSQSGLHGTDITCIHYDTTSEQLLIGYWTGKIDILGANGMRYVGGLYDKDMTQGKTIANITVAGRTAYLSTPYGIQTMDLDEYVLVDSYWLRPGGQETHVEDVMIANDSIYAFTEDSLFCASLNAELVNYTCWKREARSARISPDADKGKHYQDVHNDWYAGGTEGIVRESVTDGRISYKPQGPLVNTAYRIRYAGGKLGIVQGGYEAAFFYRPGLVMTYENGKWLNYDTQYMNNQMGVSKSEDYSDIAIDPYDPSHFFVSSFGYGLIEFRNNAFYKHHMPDNSGLDPVISGESAPYVWVDGLTFDAEGNLWMLNNSYYGVKVLKKDGTWLRFSNAACAQLNRTKYLLISRTNPNIKVLACRKAGIGVFDDNGTPENEEDDRAVYVSTFINEQGQEFNPGLVSCLFQTASGMLCVGTDKGLFCIDSPENLLAGNNQCRFIHLFIPEEDITDALGEEYITAMELDEENRLWVGTELSGLFCLSADLSQVEAHYSTKNAPLPSNNIQSVCAAADKRLFIGTGAGLMELDYNDYGPHEDIRWEEQTTVSVGSMKNWKTYFSYNNISFIEDAGEKAYCVAEGALLGVNKKSEEVVAFSKMTGLTGSNVQLVSYNKETGKTLVVYQNGQIDIIGRNGEVKNMPDVFLTTETHPTEFYSAFSHQNRIYLCTGIGIININMSKNEIAETYVLMDDSGKEMKVHYVCIIDDIIYAATDKRIYTASLHDNPVDYATWSPMTPVFTLGISAMGCKDDYMYVHAGSGLYRYHNKQWKDLMTSHRILKACIHPQSVLVQTTKALVFELTGDDAVQLNIPHVMTDMLRNGQDYWLAIEGQGLVKWNSTDGTQDFAINSPQVNLSYRLRVTNDKLIMLPGGYFAESYVNDANIMVLEGGFWRNYIHTDLAKDAGQAMYDLCDAAIDPSDPSHFFVASFGYGLMEFRDNEFYKLYMPSSTLNGLESMLSNEYGYTWVDGLTFDADGNLWMLNNSFNGVKVLLKNGTWARFGNAATSNRSRTKDLLIWNQDPTIKILTCARSNQGVGVFNDKGTITDTSDDRAVFVSTFYDQNEKAVSPQNIYSICQMANGEIWVGTEAGIIIIPDVRNLLNYDYHCRRVIIPRNDGTGLGDYLLADERINAIVEDAAGRKWIGTESSGLYLVSEDGLETIEHFTKYNSPLISDGIYALAIRPNTGEVFIGTSIGLLSYQSDANEAQENMNTIYAYPNPVRPNYQGYISITGLMDNTEVRIIDAGGNLVCKTRSNGGMAVWDGKDAYGRRVTPGVYTAMCNAAGGHNVCKILIMHETR